MECQLRNSLGRWPAPFAPGRQRHKERDSRPNLATIGSKLGSKRAGARSGGISMSESAVKGKSETTSTQSQTLTLPRAVIIEGAIDYPGPIVLSGTIEGDITCTSLTVTERGIVNGAVRSNTVTVLGEINGEIFANTLFLKAACSVTGDIFHNQLILEDGCYFEGKSRRMILPLQLVS